MAAVAKGQNTDILSASVITKEKSELLNEAKEQFSKQYTEWIKKELMHKQIPTDHKGGFNALPGKFLTVIG
jgi:hypothetical protein